MKSQHSTSQIKETNTNKEKKRENDYSCADILTVTSRRRSHLHKNSSNAASHKEGRNELTRFSICLHCLQ